ncbi:MAG: hypothetical protein QN162_15165 [Armatimonadota bacterium]|nr:hypothetical protein [Armatimonadota bacterium]
MTWPEARAEIVRLLSGLSIAEPVPLSLRRVHEYPPESLQELPCAVMEIAGRQRLRSPSRRETVYTARWWIVARDERSAPAGAVLDAFSEAVLDAFDGAVALGGKATRVEGPVVEPGSALIWGGQTYPAQRYELRVHLIESAAFAP